MSKTLKTPATFIAWEASPLFSRDKLTAYAETKRGDLLIQTTNGYEPYQGTQLTAKEAEQILAIALTDAKAGEEVSVIIRGAVILYDQLNHTKEDDFTNQKPCEGLGYAMTIQQLVFRHSLNPDWSA